jgi:hypothetical protein
MARSHELRYDYKNVVIPDSVFFSSKVNRFPYFFIVSQGGGINELCSS